MKEVQDAILFYEELGPEEQRALQQTLDADPELAETCARWQRLRAQLGLSLRRNVPSGALLVLYALEAEGRVALLPEEREALQAVRPALKRALEAHPALVDVVHDIQQASADFEAVWDAHVTSEEVSAAARQVGERHARGPRRRSSLLRWTWRAVSLAVVLAFAVVLTLLFQRDQNLVTIETGADEARLVTLADGSTVRLMHGSRLTYVPPGDAAMPSRRVMLEGNAFFEIIPDQKGFAVETATAVATVLGTSFGVQAGQTRTEVVLATGRLALAPKAAPDRLVVLEPGEMSRVDAGALAATATPVDVAEALSWTGLFVFQAASLETIAARLGEHYRVEVTVAPGLMRQQITGTFEQAQGLEAILQTLAKTLGAVVRKAGDDAYRIEM